MNRKEQSKRRRAALGQGRIVLTRSPERLNRLNLSTFATRERAEDFQRRCSLNGVRVVGVL
jgi:hypothetical protein